MTFLICNYDTGFHIIKELKFCKGFCRKYACLNIPHTNSNPMKIKAIELYVPAYPPFYKAWKYLETS